MPNTLLASVSASAGMPSAFAFATASSMRTIPSVTEYSLCILRCTKRGAGMGVAKSLPSPDAGTFTVCAVRRRDLHRAVADLGARVGGGSHRERVLACLPCHSAALDFVFLIKNKRNEGTDDPVSDVAGRRHRIRGRSRVLALVDPIHHRGKFHTAGEPRLHLRHAR